MQHIKKLIAIIKKRMILLVIIPWVIHALYLIFIASPQFESQSQLIVKSSNSGSGFDPTAMLLPAVTGTPLSNESLLVEAFVLSNDMAYFLNEEIGLAQHYQSDHADWFSRLSSDYSTETYVEFYRDHIGVEVDSTSSIITLKTRGFTPDFSQQINQIIVGRAEAFINEINTQLAVSRLKFAKNEHSVVEGKLQRAKQDLLSFQSKYNVLDPTAEGAAFQQIAFQLEGTLAQKKAELSALLASMSDTATEVLSVKREIAAIEKQIVEEKLRITDTGNAIDSLSVSELMAQYSNLQVQLELALQAYSASLITLENARVETYEQLQHLVTIESSTLPEDNAYPEVIYDLTLLAVVLLLLFGITRIVIATIRELD